MGMTYGASTRCALGLAATISAPKAPCILPYFVFPERRDPAERRKGARLNGIFARRSWDHR